jgi:hypothetical protein
VAGRGPRRSPVREDAQPQRLTPTAGRPQAKAARPGKDLEPYDLFRLEGPYPITSAGAVHGFGIQELLQPCPGGVGWR